MTVTARSNAACEPGVRSSRAARSRSISSRTRARSIAAEVVAMPRSVRPRAAARRAVDPLPRRPPRLRARYELPEVVVAVLLGEGHPPRLPSVVTVAATAVVVVAPRPEGLRVACAEQAGDG